MRDHIYNLQPVDPYTLGYWLGDGSTNSSVITTMDQEVVDRIRAAGYLMVKSGTKDLVGQPYSNPRISRKTGAQGRPLRKELRAAGVLGNKHVPGYYLLTPRQTRLNVLKGLMDSDGHLSSSQISGTFTNTNPELIEGVSLLLQSLSIRHKNLGWADRISSGYNRKPICTLKIYFDNDEIIFHIKRKIPFKHKKFLLTDPSLG